jgi:hypothetical protein
MPEESTGIPLAEILGAANGLVSSGLIKDYALGGEGDHLLLKNFPVQFLAARGLTDEAVQKANKIEYHGVRTKVFRPEYMIAIAASVRRPKDIARINLLLEQADIDRNLLETILKRYKLSLPKNENGNATQARS